MRDSLQEIGLQDSGAWLGKSEIYRELHYTAGWNSPAQAEAAALRRNLLHPENISLPLCSFN